ncbi:MAG: PEP-CTERM sorting domain-containing protein [Phycisphaerae bacterium]|nr:PEP-CTERM sorting domain-containing protein [Phycisphaerae bacterium]
MRIVPALVGGVLLAGPLQAAVFTLSDENSAATIDTTNLAGPSGLNSWSVDGTDHLNELWFWYRLGSAAETNLASLPIDVQGTTDTDFDGDPDVLFVRYLGSGFEVEVRFSLQGAALGSGTSDISEQITINNTGVSSLNFHVFQYADFDLGGDASGDTVAFASSNTVNQMDGAIALSETIVSPMASRIEAALTPVTRNSLDDGAPTTLSNVASAGPGDATWAFQWDFVLGAGDTFQIIKDKQLIVPEPTTLGLLGLGALALVNGGMSRRRKAWNAT